jgi:hypothetical protein
MASVVACNPDEPTPPTPSTPPKPPTTPVKKERTIDGYSLNDLGGAVNAAGAHADSTYFFNMKQDWEIDSAALHGLNELALIKTGRPNLVINRGGFGIYAPDNGTQYLYDVWKVPGWPVKANPDSGARPVASLADYPKFVAAGQDHIDEKPAPIKTFEITAGYLADNFSHVADSLLNATTPDTRIYMDANAPVILDAGTFPVISGVGIDNPGARIFLNNHLKISGIHLKNGEPYTMNGMGSIDMWVRHSQVFGGVSPIIYTDRGPGLSGAEIKMIEYAPENKIVLEDPFWTGTAIMLSVELLDNLPQLQHITQYGLVYDKAYILDGETYTIAGQRVSEILQGEATAYKLYDYLSNKSTGSVNVLNRENILIFSQRLLDQISRFLGEEKKPIIPYVPDCPH